MKRQSLPRDPNRQAEFATGQVRKLLQDCPTVRQYLMTECQDSTPDELAGQLADFLLETLETLPSAHVFGQLLPSVDYHSLAVWLLEQNGMPVPCHVLRG